VCRSVLQCIAVCCRVPHCVALCCSVLQCVELGCSVLRCVAVCRRYIYQRCAKLRERERVSFAFSVSVRDIVGGHAAVCCSVSQRVAVCYSVVH